MSFQNCYCNYSPCRCHKKHRKEDSCSFESSVCYESSSQGCCESSSSQECCESSSSRMCESSSSFQHHCKSQLAFGSLYNPAPSPLVPAIPPAVLPFPVVLGGLVDFTQPGPFLSTIPNFNTNSLTIVSSGVYDLSYSLNISLFTTATPVVGVSDNISVSLYVNGILDPTSTTTISRNAIGNIVISLSKEIQRFLNVGDVVTLRFSAVSLTGITSTAAYSHAALTVKELLKTRPMRPHNNPPLGPIFPNNNPYI
ncbi:hypothetical protein [Bacillus sp. 1P06AnD]|uniref:hypothetical protein n=1 Tax=Bacillus sp. 1P06AnD TaxID=3132208 RepID=UPI0039A28D15